jgi:2-aminoadipate transaminase
MVAATFDFTKTFKPDLPIPAKRFGGFAPYNFIGGHNAPESIPVEDLKRAAQAVLDREGRNLATYNLETGPQGYGKLRQYLVTKLKKYSGIDCTADDILITSGSSQGLNLINEAMLASGDTVVIEQDNYGGVLSRLNNLKVNGIGIPVDGGGMRMDALENALKDLKAKGITPKYIYTIPTVQNPTAAIMDLERRKQMIALAQQYDTAIFEDECYSDLIWDGKRPPALYALDNTQRVVHIGTFSKNIAPALRVGYIVAPWPLMSQLLALKKDAGTGALEQMLLAEYCPEHFDAHLESLIKILKAKRDALISALEEHFGTTAEFTPPEGGIFLWVKLPAVVDSAKLAQIAAETGVAINPGPEWSIDPADRNRSLRICYANPSAENIRKGIAKLAEVCNASFGVPERIANQVRE